MALKFPLSLGAICVAVALQAYAEEQTTLDTITEGHSRRISG